MSIDEPLWLGLGPGPGPRLVCHGRAASWWWTGGGPAWSDGRRLWVERGTQVVSVPLRGVVEAQPFGQDGIAAWSEHGRRVTVTGARVEVDQAIGHGLQVAVRRGRVGWEVHTDRGELDLPLGGARARWIRPFRAGRGAVWRAGSWLYRQALRQSPEVAATVAEEDRVEVGPDGVVLLGGEAGWHSIGRPGRGPRPLPCRLAVDGPLRWSAGRLAGVDLDGRATWIDLATTRVLRAQPGVVPIDTDERVLDRGVIRRGAEVLREGLVGASWALDGRTLAGPGGVAWDLRTGERLFRRPAFRFGATVAHAGGWITVDWQTGLGSRVSPTGATEPLFQLPLEPEDGIDQAWWDRDRLVVQTLAGRTHAVRDGSVRAVPTAHPPTPAPPDPDLHLGRRAVVVHGPGEPRRWPVGGEHATRVGDGIWVWDSDGRLLRLPA